MKDIEIVRRVRRELGTLWKLSPWLLVALLSVWLLAYTDLAATTGLFQSPLSTEAVSPVAAPPTPTEMVPTPAPTATATLTTTLVPTITLVPTPTLEPAVLPTAVPVTVTQTPLTPTVTLPLEITATASLSEPTTGERGRYASEDSGFVFEWSTLFDSVALGASYAWLCCGVLLLLFIPVFFVILWRAGKRRKERQE